MQHIEQLSELRTIRQEWASAGETVAFVPTMGNLHEGHLRLVDHAHQLADRVVVSIFVNPMQFSANEDLDKYPRTLAADCEALRARGADLIFTPTASMIYPNGLEQQTYVEVPGIGDILCGASRPGHFRGVATIVCKLFNMVQPEYAVFGKKDYQQLMVIRLMTQDLSLPVEIHGVETERAADGLALSSRNGYLSAGERSQATQIYQVMQWIAQGLKAGSEPSALEHEGQRMLAEAGFTPDYLSIRRQADLQIPETSDQALVILVAAYLGKTRLIDNLEVSRAP
ncbi:pantoate--beta-alanine ligase [Aliidiomarina halalkaliphila]|uniref:Pantothenate synthetase n=1 Tax=Aliidiomarina halalkaliphila TaxID=2593535 RepID=A0A552WZK1_9GAMM|nr:pantoate--beta-alanine ligase [Aliidiomarina halalkaliphila]TRW48174.1 pantoate--beta-alanine ligase [Aliidiomarina halalkaliphila]